MHPREILDVLHAPDYKVATPVDQSSGSNQENDKSDLHCARNDDTHHPFHPPPIREAPVSASARLSEDWHTLGFDRNSRTPDKVFLTAGAQGINNIFVFAFNADEKTITTQTPGMTTEYASWSTQRFVVSYRE